MSIIASFGGGGGGGVCVCDQESQFLQYGKLYSLFLSFQVIDR